LALASVGTSRWGKKGKEAVEKRKVFPKIGGILEVPETPCSQKGGILAPVGKEGRGGCASK